MTTDIEGTYEGRHHSSIPDEVLVEAIDSNTVKVQIDGFGGEPNPNGLGGGLYSGIGTGVGKLTNDSVLIVIDTVDPDVAPLGCSFTLMFKDKHRLYVKHNGGSGSFGDVDASGLYRRVKKGKPKFDD